MAIKENEILAPYTVYKIGGPARFFAEIKNSDDLKSALGFAAERTLPFVLLGAGSNMLVSDRGYDGLVIHMAGGRVTIDGENMKVDAGVMMARAVVESARAKLTGFEWGIGIPGTVGGSVRGNAGCFGYEMKDVLISAEVLRLIGGEWEAAVLHNGDCEFGYRDSVFKRNPDWIIFSAILKLRNGDPEKIQAAIKKITLERTHKQDIGTKSCGCIFKNISWSRKDIEKEKLLQHFPELGQFSGKENIPASFLIDTAGLKGKRIGKVFVSPKHANYFVNDGSATAEEVIALISATKDAVKRKFGIHIEEEIQYIGF